MADNTEGFKRINFFRGFLTTENDWNAAEAYHVEKRMLHNRMLHGPGVIPQALEGFRVKARGRGEMALEVSPGYALDGQGHDILLHEAVTKHVNVGDFEKLPATVHVIAKYIEEDTDYIAYKQNPEYKGYRRIAERAKIDLKVGEPNIDEEVEWIRAALGTQRHGVAKMSAATVGEVDAQWDFYTHEQEETLQWQKQRPQPLHGDVEGDATDDARYSRHRNWTQRTACAEGAMVLMDLQSELARCVMCGWFNEWHRFGERDQLGRMLLM